jgi:PIN domain nuclease of toxin-antitoxin system
LRAGAYAMVHRDPFDRMLAAQGELEGLVLVTRDREFAAFGATTLW